MSTGTAPLTELEAVNKMLEAVFEAPVNSLDVPSVSDAGTAKRILANTVREVLLKGYDFNTEEDVTLSPAVGTGYIPVPNNTLMVDTMDNESMRVVQRGTRLYNKEDHTFVFTRSVRCRVFYHLEWDDLPEHAKWYIMVRSARKFAATILGPAADGMYTKENEDDAKSILENAEGDTGDHNVLSDAYSVYSILER